MKSASRPMASIFSLALLITLSVAATVQAQDREKYIISATAGGINYVSGNVTVERKGGHRQQGLTMNDNLKTGDSVTTGMGGRVEVLLNPGSYMRVDENSEFELTDASLDNLIVKLVKGNTIVEVAGADETRFSIEIETPRSHTLITKSGIYRFNILPNGATEIFVRKGRLFFGDGAQNRVKGGQKALVNQGPVEVAKFDKKDQDTLDLWSKERAKVLARANGQLQRRAVSAAFTAFNTWDDWGMGLRSAYAFGLWIYSPRFGSYCFLPFGFRNFSSPYGYGYSTSVWANGGGWSPNSTQGNGSTSWGNGATGSGTGNTGGNTFPSPAPQPISPSPSRSFPAREGKMLSEESTPIRPPNE